jgi:hypothetical protein
MNSYWIAGPGVLSGGRDRQTELFPRAGKPGCPGFRPDGQDIPGLGMVLACDLAVCTEGATFLPDWMAIGHRQRRRHQLLPVPDRRLPPRDGVAARLGRDRTSQTGRDPARRRALSTGRLTGSALCRPEADGPSTRDGASVWEDKRRLLLVAPRPKKTQITPSMEAGPRSGTTQLETRRTSNSARCNLIHERLPASRPLSGCPER